MRSTEHSPQILTGSPAQRFGALVSEYARKAGYDLSAGAGGRSALARDTGMSASAVGRMLDGKTLPMPQQYEHLARAVHAEVRTLLVTAGVISARAWPKDPDADPLPATAPAQPLSPEAAADMWAITEPGIRAMLIGSVQQAIRLQNEAGSRCGQGEAVGRG